MAKNETHTVRPRVTESQHHDESPETTATPSRRRLLHLLGAGGVAGIAGCATDTGQEGVGTDTTTDTQTTGNGLQKSASIALKENVTADYWAPVTPVTPYWTNIWEPLIWASKDMQKVPWLAKSWERTGDKTWVFEIRDGVTFHNGKPLDADAVIFSFDELLTVGGGWPQSWLHIKPEGLTKIDDMTVEFTTTDVYPSFPGSIAHNFVAIVHPDTNENDEFVGTGPYQLEGVKQGQHVKVSAFDEYWNDPPKTQKLTFRVIADSNTRANALQAHDIDVAFDLPNNKVDSFRHSEKTDVVKQLAPHAHYFEINTAKTPTDDVKLRKALNFAVSQESIVKNVKDDIGVPARGPIAKIIPWAAHDSLPEYGPDVAKAKSLVGESNYDGDPLQLLVSTEEPTQAKLLAEAVQHSIQEVGVNVEIQVREQAAFQEALKEGNGHLFLVTHGTNSVAADYILYDFYYSKGCCSNWYEIGAEFDSLVLKGNRSGDLDVKKEAYGKAQRIMMEKAVIIPLYYKEYVVGTSKDIEELDVRPIKAMVRWPPLQHRT